jgi:hypothetical protein
MDSLKLKFFGSLVDTAMMIGLTVKLWQARSWKEI